MKDFTTGNEWKQIINFALPMMLGNLFMQLYQFVDTLIVGRFIGKEALAAVGASAPVVFMTIALVMGIGIGGSIVIAQYFGVKKYDKVQLTADTLLVFLGVASVLITIVGIAFGREILKLIDLPEELLPLGTDYLQIYFAGTIFLFGFNSISAILRGVGDAKTPLYFLVISSLLNVVLDLLFILGFKWGVQGAAAATALAQGMAFIMAVIYVNRQNTFLKFNILTPRFDREIFVLCLKMGLPSGFQQTFVAVGMVALMGVVNTFGTDVIAAYGVFNRIDTLVAMPVMSFSAALTSFVGQNAGAGKYRRIHRGLWATLVMSGGLCLVLNAVLIAFGHHILEWFTTDSKVIEVGYECLVVVNSTYIIFNAMFMMNGMLRGAGATVFPMLNTLFSLWLCRIPAAILLSKFFGETGIWWSMPVGWSVGLCGALIYYYSGRWKHKAVVKHVN